MSRIREASEVRKRGRPQNLHYGSGECAGPATVPPGLVPNPPGRPGSAPPLRTGSDGRFRLGALLRAKQDDSGRGEGAADAAPVTEEPAWGEG